MNESGRWAKAVKALRGVTRWLPALAALAILDAGQMAVAGDLPASKGLGKGDTVLRGDAKCTGCHDDSDNPKPTMLGERPWVLSIAKTKHGTYADGRTPTCASCHGESTAHMKRPEGTAKRPAPDRVFNKTTPAKVQDQACLSCHEGGTRMFWDGGKHANRGVACTTCHDIHNNGHDKVRDKHTQSEVCFSCHKEQRAQVSRISHHPVEEGKVACSDCHNPHGSAGPKQLKKDSVNETCYQCHMEKRGPFVHEHEPVTENCVICHNPHGSNISNLLKKRAPVLCVECHGPSSHPSQPPALFVGSPTEQFNTNARAGWGTEGRACLNCHTNIHGGNSTQNNATAARFRR